MKRGLMDTFIMNKLKPCPFCGGTAHIAYDAKRKIYGKDEYRSGVAIYCGVCEARMFYPSQKLAVESWNRRAKYESNEYLNPGLMPTT